MIKNLTECDLLQFPKILDPRGKLSVIENSRQIPFDIQRIYYMWDVPLNTSRGAHAHKKLQQVMIAIAGKFSVLLDNGKETKTVILDTPNSGLLIPNLIWHEMTDFTNDAICLMLASDYYDEADYFRDYNEFLKAVKTND